MQVVGQMQPGPGGVQRAPQPSVPLIPGLQALLAQQASTRPGTLQGVGILLPPRGRVLCIGDCSGPHRKPANLAITWSNLVTGGHQAVLACAVLFKVSCARKSIAC